MPPTQQYPVTSGTAGFYPGTSPAEYPTYGKVFFFFAQDQQQLSTTINIEDYGLKGVKSQTPVTQIKI